MYYTIKEFYDAETYFEFKKLFSTLFRTAIKELENKEEFIRSFENNPREPDFLRLGAFDEDRLCAAVQFPCYKVNFDNKELKMSGVGGVISDFNQPYKGAVKQIFKKAFEIMKEKGIMLSHLYPFEENYYRQYGYEISCESATWEIPVSAFKRFENSTFVAFDNSEKMKKEIADIYSAFSADRNMSVVRDENYWDKFFDTNKAYSSGKHLFVSYVNGNADGFMMVTIKENADRPFDFNVSRLYFKSYAGLRGILSYFSTQKAYADKVYINLPADVDISPIIDSCTGYGKRHSNHKITNMGQTRVVDVENLLKIAEYQGEGSVTIKITNDLYCPWNNDCFTVNFGKETLVQRGGNPDIEMDINSFSSGIMGRTILNSLVIFPDVKIYGNQENLKKVFYKKNCWIEEHF